MHIHKRSPKTIVAGLIALAISIPVIFWLQKIYWQEWYYKKFPGHLLYTFEALTFLLLLFALKYWVPSKIKLILEAYAQIVECAAHYLYTHLRLTSLLMFCLLFILKMSILEIPAFADETYYLYHSYYIFLQGPLQFWQSIHCRSPLLFALSGAFYSITGPTIGASHCLMLIFTTALFIYTLRVGAKIFNPLIGFCAAMLMMASPIIMAQSGLYLLDLPSAACCVAALYYYLSGNRWKWLLSATALLLMKESNIALFLALIAFHGIDAIVKRKPLFKIMQEILLFGSPLLGFALFMIFNALMWGFPLWINPHIIFFTPPHYAIPVLKSCIASLLWHLKSCIMAALGTTFLLAFLHKVTREKILRPPILLLIAACCTHILCIALAFRAGGLQPRYMLPIMPIYFLGGTACIFHLTRRNGAGVTAATLLLVLFIGCWNTNTTSYVREINMAYVSTVKAYQAALSFTERYLSNETIVTSWPLDQCLTNSYLGYVRRPLRNVITNIPSTNAPFSILLSTFNTNWQKQAQTLASYVKAQKAQPNNRFSTATETILLYRINPSP